jgi:hypothetical protein
MAVAGLSVNQRKLLPFSQIRPRIPMRVSRHAMAVAETAGFRYNSPAAMLATQTGAFCRMSLQGDVVQFPANTTRIIVPLVAALALCGCANVDLENKDAWFSKPFEFVSRKGGYTFSELQDTKQRTRPLGANDFVDASGACPAPAPQPASTVANQTPNPDPAPSNLGLGVALGMTECDVVSRTGAPSAVQIGKNPNGDRSAVLTFNSGQRPGIYRFEGGMLTAIDRVQTAPPPPQTAKKKSPASPNASKQAPSKQAAQQ